MKTSDLGLAAFIKIRDGNLKKCEGKDFIFDTDKSEDEWRVEYLNSECYRHDSELLSLKKFRNRDK